MEIDQGRISRLMHLSKGQSHDPYERFAWPPRIADDQPWCSDDLLTTYGTEYQDQLSPQQARSLSKWEAVNFFSLNVHGIKGVLAFASSCIYEKKYQDISEYLHIFIGEENFHMWYFAKACLDYAGKIYPSTHLPGSGNTDDENLRDLYMFVSTLIFEEFVDYYNHKVGTSDGIIDILKQVNYQHHLDESRHVSFGREVVPRLYADAIALSSDPEETKADVSRTVVKMFRYFISLMYNPLVYEDSAVVRPLGFASGNALRNALRSHPARKKMHALWFKRSANFFVKSGLVAELHLDSL
ncbi:diiron oxygenase [Robbsia sp. Bb-Pol-6]|uniref:Diiron oxygenase n=1 Tax=Robbsia betulipollinis TaxID=2981849 RepID=A0ABT3ZQY5_9BURK|nr:diiron oxygenase [Robbsia betulipollinis]MCY0388969.1 diiron oxygenase [Robbsia betulipollinis]